MKRAFEKAHKARFGFIDRDQADRRRSRFGRGGRRRRQVQREGGRRQARQAAEAGAAHQIFLGTAPGTRPMSTRASQLKPGSRVMGAAIIIEPHQTIVVEPGWQAELTRKNHLVLDAREKAQAHSRHRHPCRSGHARSVQQSVHVDRRADGRDAAEHRLLGEHQGAARFLLRGVRRTTARSSPMRRICRCIWARWTARSRPSFATTKAGSNPATSMRSTRPITAARICPTLRCARRCSTTTKKRILFWVASRGHHADVGGISPGSMSPNATTIEEEGVYIDNFKLVDRGRFREAALMTALTGAKYPARNPVQNINDIKAQIAANEKGVAELRKMVAHFTLPVVEGLYAARAGQRGRKRAPRDRPAARLREFAYEMDQGTVDQGQDHGRQAQARGDRRFHRHLAAAADQLQRAGAGDARGGALRVPRHGRRRHPDERRLPAADQHRHSRSARC